MWYTILHLLQERPLRAKPLLQVNREYFHDAAAADVWDKWHCKQQLLRELKFIVDL